MKKSKEFSDNAYWKTPEMYDLNDLEAELEWMHLPPQILLPKEIQTNKQFVGFR